MITFWAIVENIAYEGKTAATTFWVTLIIPGLASLVSKYLFRT